MYDGELEDSFYLFINHTEEGEFRKENIESYD